MVSGFFSGLGGWFTVQKKQKKLAQFILSASEQVEKIANNNGFGSVISKLIRTSFFAVGFTVINWYRSFKKEEWVQLSSDEID